jgi:HSP20 family protein
MEVVMSTLADVSESGSEIRLRLEAPVLEADDFNLHVVGNVLAVHGDKQIQREQTEGRFHIMGCAYGSFERAVPLPVEVNEHQAGVRYKPGVLNIRLPQKTVSAGTPNRSQVLVRIRDGHQSCP